MDQLQSLPFKVGDRVEAKSFQPGYRGAWFRYEIKGTGNKGVAVEYIDYPDEEIKWMKSIYQKRQCKPKSRKPELMLRPKFPPVYREDEAPDANTLSEVIVVTKGVWKVGDLVDWFWNGAYWSATITEVLGDDKVQLLSLPRPFGEGTLDEAFCKDLRPSLDWSPTSGWKLPLPKGNKRSQGNKSYCPCARLIFPVNQEKMRNDGRKDIEKESPSGPSLPSSHIEKKDMDMDTKGSFSDGVSSSTFAKAEEVAGQTHSPETNKEAAKRIKLNKHIPLTSSTCDSLESLITDMEELLNRVKWMKRIVDPHESVPSKWKFQEYRAGGNRSS